MTVSTVPSPIEVLPFDDAKTFLDYLRRSGDHWSEGPLETPWIFRGQSRSEWPLRPRLWREETGDELEAISHYVRHGITELCHEVLTKQEQRNLFLGRLGRVKMVKAEDLERTHVESIVRLALAEREMLFRFVELGDELGYPTGDPREYQKGHLSLVGNLGEVIPLHMPDEAALAQHHGVPTRLLDWTYRPETAAFFAAEKVQACDGELVVWALHKDACSRRYPPATVFTKPILDLLTPRRFNHTFLHAQDGVFTWIVGAESHYLDEGIWPTVDDIVCRDAKALQGQGIFCPLRKLTLVRTQAENLLRLLWKERISRAHLMPTYDNIAASLNARWRMVSSASAEGSS